MTVTCPLNLRYMYGTCPSHDQDMTAPWRLRLQDVSEAVEALFERDITPRLPLVSGGLPFPTNKFRTQVCYATVTRPLRDRYADVARPSHHRCMNVT